MERERIKQAIEDKTVRKSQISTKEYQNIYFREIIAKNKTCDNSELLKQFNKDFPEAEYVLNSKSISMIKQNLKRSNIDLKKNSEGIDDILNNKGKKLLREKVK